MYSTGGNFGFIQPFFEQHILGRLQVKKFFKIVGVLFVIGIIGGAIKNFNKSSHDVAKNNTQNDVALATPAVKLPDAEAQFVGIVEKAQEASRSADNDLQKGGVRATREKDICAALNSLGVSDWVGEVNTLSSNSDGKGVLSIRIAPDVFVRTWNNAVSDVLDNTLIEPSSPLFSKASQMKEGQTIKFSGSFFKSTEESVGCLSESSLTLDGKLSAPEFVFRFSDLSLN
jgi:hypothetical protein